MFRNITQNGMTMEANRTSTILLRDCFIHEQESKTIKRKFIGQHENTDTFSGEFIKQGKILNIKEVSKKP